MMSNEIVNHQPSKVDSIEGKDIDIPPTLDGWGVDANLEDDIQELIKRIHVVNLDSEGSPVQRTPDERALEKAHSLEHSMDSAHKASIFCQSTSFWEAIISYTSKPKHQIGKLDVEIAKFRPSLECVADDQRSSPTELALPTTESMVIRNTTSEHCMGNLPIEIWGHIFFLCLPSDDFVIPNPCHAPLLLCQICGSWKNIAIGTPLLWSSLSIPVNGSWRYQTWKSFVEIWLKRSGNTFLFLDVSFPTYLEPTCDSEIFQLITSTANRWRHLRLNMAGSLISYMLNNPMPELQDLELSSIYPLVNLTIEAAHVPKLKSISLLTKPLYPQSFSIPWNQLTHFSSKCWLNICQHIEILRKCPSLKSYSMYLVQADILPDFNSLLLVHLTTLHIVAYFSSGIGPVLNRLRLPSLSELSLVVPDESPTCRITDWPKAYVISLVKRSSCNLTRIRFKGIDVSEESLADAKKLIPTLTSVEIL